MPADIRARAGLEFDRLAAAFQLLTRFPVRLADLPADWLARSSRYFPLVGVAVGAIAGLVLLVAARLWPVPIPALLAVAAAILATGALHEDGLADSADSLGGRTPERRLAIMRDSRLGTFGALALGLTVAAKVAALSVLPPVVAAAALIAAGALARAFPTVVMATTDYADTAAAAKLDHGTRAASMEVAIAFVTAALASVALAVVCGRPAAVAIAAGASALLSAAVARTLCRNLGGHTGDVLGAVVGLGECAFLLALAAGGV